MHQFELKIFVVAGDDDVAGLHQGHARGGFLRGEAVVTGVVGIGQLGRQTAQGEPLRFLGQLILGLPAERSRGPADGYARGAADHSAGDATDPRFLFQVITGYGSDGQAGHAAPGSAQSLTERVTPGGPRGDRQGPTHA